MMNELRFTPALTLLEDFGANGQCAVTLSGYRYGSDDVMTVKVFASKRAAQSFIDGVRLAWLNARREPNRSKIAPEDFVDECEPF